MVLVTTTWHLSSLHIPHHVFVDQPRQLCFLRSSGARTGTADNSIIFACIVYSSVLIGTRKRAAHHTIRKRTHALLGGQSQPADISAK